MQAPVVVPPSQTPLKRLAIAQLVIGILAILLGSASKVVLSDDYGWNWVSSIGTGIWSGVWIIVTGIIGIRSTRNTMNVYGTFTAYMIFSIISTCVSGAAVILLTVAVICNAYGHYIGFYDCDSRGPECIYIDNTHSLVLFIPLLILMFVNFISSIVSAAYCCQCCRGPSHGQQPVIITATGQVIPVYTPHQINYSQYPLQQGNMMQYPPQPPNVTQYISQQPNAAQYAPQQPNATQYPPQQPNAGQYTTQQPNAAHHPPQQPNTAEDLPQQPNAAQYLPQQPNTAEDPPQQSNTPAKQATIVYADKPPEYSTRGYERL